MGRKAFMSDLNAAKATKVPGIGQVTSKEDGEFSFLCQPGNFSITVSVMEPSSYPESHDCFVFADDNAPPNISNALEKIPDQSRKKIEEILSTISSRLAKATSDGDEQNEEMTDIEESDLDEDDLTEAEDDWGLDDTTDANLFAKGPGGANTLTNPTFDDQSRKDLAMTRMNGLKVGALGKLSTGTACFVSIACRFSKLGISEEAMQAWSVEPDHYLILLLYYPAGYKSWKFLKSLQPQIASQYIKMHVGMCDTYKPRSFDDAKRSMNVTNDSKSNGPEDSSFRDTFVSGPMDNLLNERFLFLLKNRVVKKSSWTEAEISFESTYQQTTPTGPFPDLDLNFTNQASTDAPDCELSLPLFAYEYLLRHFVHCTKFCLVCHRRLNTNIEALKPYVCESDLCLYQYMSLGFGPSIDHEIIAQPYVVDTLISFCYASAENKKLATFPTGMALNVPDPNAKLVRRKDSSGLSYSYGTLRGTPSYGRQFGAMPETDSNRESSQSQGGSLFESKSYDGLLDERLMRLTIEDEHCPVKAGDWIVLCSHETDRPPVQCKIRSRQYFPTLDLSEMVPISRPEPLSPEIPGLSSTDMAALRASKPKREEAKVIDTVRFAIFDKNLDDLNHTDKCQSIIFLLDGLPSVIQMRDFCLQSLVRKLSEWTERINPAAFGLVRWIIASNRSCILQLDEFADPTGVGNDSSTSLGVRHERVSGMHDYMQFRFATGSPEKEAKFIKAIADETLGKPYPTLFAWHGSPLHNWHSIIREGLHYKRTDHGRAFGHGCYHAKDFHVSRGYSDGYSNMAAATHAWPPSCLQFSAAYALSEIVNCPQEFQCSNPHYVIQHIDWIQTRYLFVKPRKQFSFSQDVKKGSWLPQDPLQIPTGPNRERISLPMTTVSSSRRVETGNKKHKTTEDVEMMDASDDNMSVATLDEDAKILEAPEEASPQEKSQPEYKPPRPTQPSTPVLPYSPVLPKTQLLPPPAYATPAASKQLQREMRALLASQETAMKNGTLAELGWFLHSEHISESGNLFQWIISLHSFPLDLPLTKDMERAKLQDVLLEMRFAANFPLSPPFVRVIRPRFLPFLQGGGGHVTAGGSICMELLTNDGWLPSSNIESVLLQIRVAMMSTEPRPAKLEGRSGEYQVGEAVEAYIRACRAHGWSVPDEIKQVTGG